MADNSENQNSIMNTHNFAVCFVSAIVKAAFVKTAASTSFSQSACKAIAEFNAACPIGTDDRAVQVAGIFGNGLKGEKHEAGSLVLGLRAEAAKAYEKATPCGKTEDKAEYSAKVAEYVKGQLAHVRNDMSVIRAVVEGSGNPLVIEAMARGLRAAYSVARPKAPKAPKEPTQVKPDANPSYSQAYMVALVSQHIDDAIFALRDYLIRAKDSAGIARITEVEIHLASKTAKAA